MASQEGLKAKTDSENILLRQYAAGTVLELMADTGEQPNPVRAGGPQPTPPVPMETTTRSGSGYAQMADDSMTDHMYE